MHISLDSALGQQRRLNQLGETISSIAAPKAAYSLRSLTGGDPKSVRVRRSSDDSEQDFTVSGVNSGALVAFVGSGNDGFVSKWYDQSGNSKDAVQATAGNQPKIVNSGSLVVDSSIAGIDFDGSGFLVASSVSGLEGSISMFAVSVRDASGYVVSLSNSSAANRYFGIQEAASTVVANPRNTSNKTVSDSVSGADRLSFAVTTGATSTSVGANGSTVTTTTNDYGDNFAGSNLDQIAIGILRTVSASGQFNGRIREILVYSSDQTSNRTALETNINSYYSVF
tara:strand:+ start:990 stop:1838 length:849 start_codon:yes stop_codon:yes gene_type:complete